MTTSGRVVWWEIETPDPEGSQRFYSELFGWTFRWDFNQPGSQLGRDYWTIESDGEALGGLQRALPGAPAAQAGVRLYVEVSDLEAVLARAEALGAGVERERTYLGADDFWFANFRDPQGISVGLWTRSGIIAAMPLLFSYGTLRDPAVQRATFGRELPGHADQLVGYALRTLEITNPAVVAVSGQSHHPIVTATGDPADRVDGTVLEVTEAELAAADGYEVDDYHRVLAPLASGSTAWVYVQRR